jgi:hypothetical protein
MAEVVEQEAGKVLALSVWTSLYILNPGAMCNMHPTSSTSDQHDQ